MRLLKKDRSGVSEVVGAIMLVMIVVIAASSFAIFISQYQENVQAQRLDDQKRTQEKIKVTSIEPINGTGTASDKWVSLNFTVASMHNERSEIVRIAINDRMVMRYDVYRVSPYTGLLEKREGTALDQLTLAAKEQLYIYVDMENPLAMSTPLVLSTSGYVKIDISTAWSNEFSKTFSPPSAVATHSPGSWTNTTSGKPVQEYYATLNGRSSVAYDGAYIMSWNWTVVSMVMNETGAPTWYNSTASGSVCRVDFPLKGAWNEVTLTVMDNFGMIGSSTIKFYN